MRRLACGGAGLLAGTALLPGAAVVLAGIGLAAGWIGTGLWRRRSARLAMVLAAAEVRETCELLGAELSAGLPPGSALQRAAECCAALRPVAEAFALGGDVPGALRAAATEPGRRDLALLAAGWQVAHRSGAGLADTVERVAGRLRAEEQTARMVAGELASARATARLVAALPVAALTLGAGTGGSPWEFLLTTTPGLACLAGGLSLGLAGLWWIEVLTGDAT
ncbi:type II secretion system F family protein [Nocardioides bigeumensis]|uniref:type II secretion system F family protein n=1 Tax=Nocardioides bigeumensis TaxID=433657 RepID=UPI0031D1970A